jgi:hypothetical protein
VTSLSDYLLRFTSFPVTINRNNLARKPPFSIVEKASSRTAFEGLFWKKAKRRRSFICTVEVKEMVESISWEILTWQITE